MSNKPSNVEQFVSKVKRRLNRYRIRDAIIWATLIGGSVMLIVALSYVLFGYRVPVVLYPCVLGATFVGAAIWAIVTRSSADHAASFADQFFGLRDAISSYLGFAQAGQQGGFYDLQAAQTEKMIRDKEVEKIVKPASWRRIAIALVLLAISVSLGFKATSPEIVKRMEREKQTLAMTIDVNDQIKDLVEELEKSADDPHERKLLAPDKLRQWVNELKETTDLHEAKRQYSKMELRLNRAAEALQQRRDEELLDKAAEELGKDLESIDLSKKLKYKKYDQAADELKDLKPTEKIKDPKKLSEARKDLAKLKAAAKRMATAAKNTKASNNDGEQSDDAEEFDGGLSESDDSEIEEGEGEDGDLSEAIQGLEDAVDDYDEVLEQIEMYDDPYGEEPQWSEEELEEANRAVRSKMDDLGDRMRKMAGRRKARSKLKKLCKRVAQCQNGARSKQPGGTKAGKEDGTRERSETDKREDNGNNTKLKGIKGSGPSITQIQSADDGDGTTQKKSVAKKRDFKRQFESFVEREDIPEDLKSGVKEYFTKIHQTAEPESNSESSGDNVP